MMMNTDVSVMVMATGLLLRPRCLAAHGISEPIYGVSAHRFAAFKTEFADSVGLWASHALPLFRSLTPTKDGIIRSMILTCGPAPDYILAKTESLKDIIVNGYGMDCNVIYALTWHQIWRKCCLTNIRLLAKFSYPFPMFRGLKIV